MKAKISGMQFTVPKTALQIAYSTASKLVPKFTCVYLFSEDSNLWLVISQDNYVKVLVPQAEVKSEGIICIVSEVFSQIFTLRGDVIEAKCNVETKSIEIDCGSKSNIFEAKSNKDVTTLPTISEEIESSVKLSADSCKRLKKIIDLATFVSPDITTSEYAKLVNVTQEDNSYYGFSIKFGAANSSAYYHDNTSPLSDKDFDCIIPIIAFKTVFNYLGTTFGSTKVNITFTNSLVVLKNEAIFVTIPIIQSENLGWIDRIDEVICKKKELFTKPVYMEAKEALLCIASTKVISDGTSVITVVLNNQTITFNAVSDYGKSNDHFSVNNKHKLSWKFDVLEGYFGASLTMCKNTKQVDLSLSNEGNMYLMGGTVPYSTKKDNDGSGIRITVLGPLAK